MVINDKAYWTEASAITLDSEFQALAPPPSADEQALLEAALRREGCRETLMAWACGGRKILLVGYEFFPTLRLDRIPFQAVDCELASREEARLFIIKHLLGKHSLSLLAVSYLRGLRYQAEKQPNGGDRRSGLPLLRKTAEALAEIFHVSPITIRRDAQVAEAVNRIVALCGEKAKALLLARDCPLRRGRLLKLAGLPENEQKCVIGQWFVEGKLSRHWQTNGKPSTITLPRNPVDFARVLVRRLGRERAAEILEAIKQELNAEN